MQIYLSNIILVIIFKGCKSISEFEVRAIILSNNLYFYSGTNYNYLKV